MAESGRPVEPELRTPDAEHFFHAVVELRKVEDCQKFLGDLLTREEVLRFIERWKIARLLDAGYPYKHITRETGASAATIARVKERLAEGRGGLALMVQRFRQR